LVRTICTHCKRRVRADAELLSQSGLNPATYGDVWFYEGAGCLECGGTGYKGRMAISELLDLSDNVRELILARRSSAELKREAPHRPRCRRLHGPAAGRDPPVAHPAQPRRPRAVPDRAPRRPRTGGSAGGSAGGADPARPRGPDRPPARERGHRLARVRPGRG